MTQLTTNHVKALAEVADLSITDAEAETLRESLQGMLEAWRTMRPDDFDDWAPADVFLPDWGDAPNA